MCTWNVIKTLFTVTSRKLWCCPQSVSTCPVFTLTPMYITYHRFVVSYFTLKMMPLFSYILSWFFWWVRLEPYLYFLTQASIFKYTEPGIFKNINFINLWAFIVLFSSSYLLLTCYFLNAFPPTISNLVISYRILIHCQMCDQRNQHRDQRPIDVVEYQGAKWGRWGKKKRWKHIVLAAKSYGNALLRCFLYQLMRIRE